MVYRMEPVSTKVPGDIVEQIEELQDEHDISRSAAARRLLRKGIEKERAEQTDRSKSQAVGAVSLALLVVGALAALGSVSLTVESGVGPGAGTGLLVVGLIGALAAVYIRREHETP